MSFNRASAAMIGLFSTSSGRCFGVNPQWNTSLLSLSRAARICCCCAGINGLRKARDMASRSEATFVVSAHIVESHTTSCLSHGKSHGSWKWKQAFQVIHTVWHADGNCHTSLSRHGMTGGCGRTSGADVSVRACVQSCIIETKVETKPRTQRTSQTRLQKQQLHGTQPRCILLADAASGFHVRTEDSTTRTVSVHSNSHPGTLLRQSRLL